MPASAREKVSRVQSPTLSFKPRSTFTSTLHNLNFHSSSTLQHSEIACAFPKAKRFSKSNAHDAFAQLEIPSTLNTRGATFGFGTKKVFNLTSLTDAQWSPGPNKYSVKTSIDFILSKNRVPTIGSPRSAYLRIYYPEIFIPDPRITAEWPGPATYTVREEPGRQSRITIKPKGKMFNEIKERSPPCNLYMPKESVVQSTRYREITFGHGPRSDFTRTKNRNPGPGKYTLPSAFDKYSKSKNNRSVRVRKNYLSGFMKDLE